MDHIASGPVVYVIRVILSPVTNGVMKGYARNDNFTVVIRRLLTCMMKPDFGISRFL